ncbi:MAG TPA: peptidase domain-containing ABC transporter [Polyangiales bacterium]|nr:peptidase domain-containing ABC transporter [Polyangiales bacterium]
MSAEPSAQQQRGNDQPRVREPVLRRLRPAKEVPFIPQLTPTDCGAACLASVLAFHDKHVPIYEVRSLLVGGRNGVNALALVSAARTFGFSARGVKIDLKTLRYLPAGSILHWDLAHFVVFEGCTAKHVTIVDPALGRRRISYEQCSKSLSGVAVVCEPGQRFVKQRAKHSGRLRRYAAWILGVRGVWGRIIMISLFLQVLALAIPGLTAVLVDKVIPRADMSLLALVGSGFITLASFYFLSNLLRSRLLLELRTRVEARMAFNFVEHLFDLPYSFFQQRTTGDLMMRLSSQSAIRELLTTGALSALLDGTLVMLYFVMLVSAAPNLAWVALSFAVFQVIAYVIASKRNALLVTENLAAQARLEGYQVEMLSGIETLKSMGATERTLMRWNDLYVHSLNRSISRGRLDGTFGALLGTLGYAGPVTLLIVGAQSVLDNGLSLGSMLGLSALAGGFLSPVSNLVATGMRLSQLPGYMERIEDVLEAPREPVSAARLGQMRGALEITELAFKYPSEREATLNGVTFGVAAGECVAIVGASGSGKSTLARLLAGLYEPTSGSIAYDGRDLRGWDLSSLRERLGIVTQDTRLFSGTIRDNVALFDPNVPQDDVERACELACLDDVVATLPMGYDTMLADGGSSMSGGQRQRLSLARALVRRPSVLILDEATSALDVVTERRVQTQLRTVRCTRVIVAHRLSTIVEADKIVVLHAGRVVGVGQHAGLMNTCEHYRNLVRAQGLIDQGNVRTQMVAHIADTPGQRSAPRSSPATDPRISPMRRRGITQEAPDE